MEALQGLIFVFAALRLFSLPLFDLILAYSHTGSLPGSILIRTAFYFIVGWYLMFPARGVIKRNIVALECRQKQAEILAR
jgi:hypothetical protein